MEIIKKNAEQFETQQKALELALECLENSSKQELELTEEEKFWIRMVQLKTICLVQKDFLKKLLETVNIKFHKEYVTRNKPIEYLIEYYFQKPLKDCNLNEVVNGLVISCSTSNWFDTVDYVDDGKYYTLKITHSLGLNNSKISQTFIESVFKTYGVKVESIISEKTMFIKIFKEH